MPQLSWPEFTDRHPKGHLVVAVLPRDGPRGNVREQVNLMARILSRLARGEYALTVNLLGQTPEIRCALESGTDVENIAVSLAAQSVRSSPGWASQHSFKMDAAASKTISDALDEV